MQGPPNQPPVPPQGMPPQPKAKKGLRQQLAERRAEAEKAERARQERLKELELSHILGGFNRRLKEEILDQPMIHKLACNVLKELLKVDHVALSMRGEPAAKEGDEDGSAPANEPQPFKVVAESDLPKVKAPEAGQPPDPKAAPIPVSRMAWEWPPTSALMQQMLAANQGVMLPDVNQFPDDTLKAAVTKFSLKSIYFLPVVVGGQIIAFLEVQATQSPKLMIPVEVTFAQKLCANLARAIENAPPILPDELKGVVKKLQKANNPNNVDLFNKTFDLVFTLIMGELEDEEHEDLIKVMERDEQPPLQLWLRLALMTQLTDERASICRLAFQELYQQHREHCQTLEIKVVPGYRDLIKYMGKFPLPIAKDLLPEEPMTKLDEDIDQAVRGQLFHEKRDNGLLINDIEQTQMMVNFVSIPAAFDLRQQIKSHLVNLADEVDPTLLLDRLCQASMREIAKSTAREMAEKVLYEQEGFLEQSSDDQLEKIEALAKYLHYRLMGNLIPVLRGQASDWSKKILKDLKERSKEAAKQRAVLVGKLLQEDEAEAEE